jgi:hypothetical protein
MNETRRYSTGMLGFVVGGLLAAMPLTAQQNACEVMQHGMATTGLKEGAWVSYQIPDGGSMKRSVVGKEERDGKTYYWLEMSFQGKKKKKNAIVKRLVPGWASLGDVKEMIFQQAGEPAMRVPTQVIAMMASRMKDPIASATKECEKIQYLGETSVTVPAGTFKAKHFKNDEGEMWGSEELAFFLIKVLGKEGSIELTGHGNDATSAITGPIQDMPGF